MEGLTVHIQEKNQAVKAASHFKLYWCTLIVEAADYSHTHIYAHAHARTHTGGPF